ncbi:3-hydroxyacyl-CoA dehydrogenase [Corynebacterium bovis]|uniref:3-hydroxybutyryl-CoA dehydrogenase n=1 Tax=Corynebacterium bovis TaxID=36808 RepID=A0A426PYE6_9CORY|nr:3-hydroxyacyl-CoA dehydrogenase [Corynebacterium bovis]MDN8579551.1 3-hydroxyacyl-CoA dehydrogenase [Corynebacterium bovis]RRO86391.1 3-hydroxybutyryl-CoA dehydrogenase [Corynebacterium bovis]
MADATTISSVTVLGAGVLGAQIAFQAAYAGFDVVSYDINDDALAAARDRFDRTEGYYRREVDGADDSTLAAARERLTQSADLAAAVSAADLVIEAVPETLDLKREVWGSVGDAAPEGAVFTTNTSTLRPSDFAGASGREERFLALHFANHIWTNRTAEVMPTPATDGGVFDTVVQFARDMGMEPVVLKKEQPGYVLNSLLVPFLEAGQRLWADDVADPHEIDRDWRMSTGSPMGPFQGMDVIGLRTVHQIAEEHADETGDDLLREAARRLQEEYLDKGLTGQESGQGFYRYTDDGSVATDPGTGTSDEH